jgi:hypothetical protein
MAQTTGRKKKAFGARDLICASSTRPKNRQSLTPLLFYFIKEIDIARRSLCRTRLLQTQGLAMLRYSLRQTGKKLSGRNLSRRRRHILDQMSPDPKAGQVEYLAERGAVATGAVKIGGVRSISTARGRSKLR